MTSSNGHPKDRAWIKVWLEYDTVRDGIRGIREALAYHHYNKLKNKIQYEDYRVTRRDLRRIKNPEWKQELIRIICLRKVK